MPPFERDRFFLGFMASLGLLLVIVGVWEWQVAHSPHNIILGLVTLGLSAAAIVLTRRNGSTRSGSG
jgi:hypothetical protein